MFSTKLLVVIILFLTIASTLFQTANGGGCMSCISNSILSKEESNIEPRPTTRHAHESKQETMIIKKDDFDSINLEEVVEDSNESPSETKEQTYDHDKDESTMSSTSVDVLDQLDDDDSSSESEAKEQEVEESDQFIVYESS